MAETETQEALKGKLRILVADDEIAIRERLKRSLVSRGHEVTAVEDGAQALEEARGSKFHLAILDLMMPHKGGLETLDGLKDLDPGIEVVIVTGYASPVSADEAIKKGAYAYLIKPFDMLELEALLPSVYEKVGLKALVGLLEATRSVFADVDLQDLLQDLMNLACKILAADESTLILRGDDGVLRIAASSSPIIRSHKGSEVNLDDSVAGRVARWKTGVSIEGPLNADPRFADLPSHRSVRHSLVFPILLKDDLEGILCANRAANKALFQPQDLRHAAIFCSHVAQAIENAKLYGKLREARTEALQANQQKDELLYITAHDLKTPLGIVQGYIERMTRSGGDQRKIEELGGRAIHAIDGMVSLIRQILRKGQLESGQYSLDRTPHEIEPIVDDCLRDFEVLAAKKSLRIIKESKLPAGHTGNIDNEAFIEILTNLMGNAIKFCDNGGSITVGLDHHGDRLILRVADDGPGIPEEEQKHLFERFHRGSAAQPGGSGYGLAIVKTLAEIHGGGVRLSSGPDIGTVFTVFLAEN